MPYYVYIIQCNDNSLYTGYSRNVDRRVRQHLEGKGARYLRIHRPKRLVYVEEFQTRAEAMKREKRVKSLNHEQKIRLTRSRRRNQNRAAGIGTGRGKARRNSIV